MRKFGLIGYPLSHSFSKNYFSEKFAAMGITDCEYDNFSLSSIEAFPNLLETHPDLEGLNVTIPYKKKVIPYLDRLEDAAGTIGAVNCIHFTKGEKIGYNTDVIGFRKSLYPLIKKRPEQALILGTGGASKAVAYVLKQLCIGYKFVSRRPVSGGFTYEELTREIVEAHTLIVNTTPVGTSPKTEEAPALPYEFLTATHILFDLVYNPAETRFLSLGKERGATTTNGYDMLIGQAEASWDIWTGE